MAISADIPAKEKDNKVRLTSCDLLVLKINQFLEPKYHDLWRVFRGDRIPDEIRRSHTAGGRSSRIPSQDDSLDFSEFAELHVSSLHPRIYYMLVGAINR